jgi:hypothetical protein
MRGVLKPKNPRSILRSGLVLLTATSTAVAGAAPDASSSPTAPATPLGRTAAVMERVEKIAQTLKSTAYSHVTRVNESEGSYVFDCSGFVAWVLRRAAMGAHLSVVSRSKDRRPLARDYYWEIARTRPSAGRGWARVERVMDARPGDVVAWLKPPQVRSPHTGHVAFIVEAPEPSRVIEGGYLVRVADASRYYHQDDEREELGRSGFGVGTILIVADPVSQAPTAYGWFGERSAWVLPAQIAIGRPTR